ncbi:MAG: hypothetical protein DMF67_01605 [Acidobacteria bacterium]|nr:MAG: hypothetical protein DMF67_01605 [Acidobacteriota bacterium]
MFAFLLGVLALALFAAAWAARRGGGALAAGRPLAYTAPAGGAENRYTLRRRGDDLVLSDDRTGAVLRSQPLAATSRVVVRGADGETNDTLTVDFGGGVFSVPEGISYDGGAGGFDTLAIAGGTATDERYQVNNASDGVITLDEARIYYSNIEPINDTVPAATLTFNATPAGEQINIVDGPVVSGTQTTQVNSGASNTFELINFANKINVTVNGLGGSDAVTFNVNTPAAGLSSLTVDAGSDAGDTATITSFKLPGGTFTLQGVGSINGPGAADGNADLVASTISLNTTGGTIGTSAAVPLEVDASTLNANSSGGNIFITDTSGGVAIGQVNAGAGNVNLTSAGNSLTSVSPNDGTAEVIGNVVTLKATGASNGNTGQIGFFTTGAQFFEVDSNVLNASTNNSRLWIREVGSGPTAGTAIGLVNAGTNTAFLQTQNGGSLTSQTVDGTADVTAATVNLRANNGGNLGASTASPLEISASTLDAAVLNSAGAINILQTAGNLNVTNATTNNGNISVQTVAGDLTVGTTVSAGAGAVSLTAGSTGPSPEHLLTNNGTVTGTSATLTADRMALDSGTIIVGTGAANVVTLRSFTLNRAVNLDNTAGDPAGELRLSQTELSTLTAGAVRIGRSDDTANLTVKSVISSPAGWAVLHLITGGGISQSGGGAIAVPNLAAQAGVGVSLLTNPNTVSILAGSAGGVFRFGSTGSLSVGAVDGVAGVNDTASAADVTLTVNGAGNVLTVSQPIASSGSNIILTADNMDLNAAVNAGTGTVILTPFILIRAIDLGTESGIFLSLTDAELDRVTATVLEIGSASPQYQGQVEVAAPITQAGSGYTTLEINTTGAVSNSGGSIAGTNLLILSGNGIGSVGAPLATSVANIEFINIASGNVKINNTGNLEIGNVIGDGGLNPIGAVTLSTTGSMSFKTNVLGAGDVTLTSGTGNFLGAGGGVTAANNLIFNDQSSAGHTWTIGPTSLAESPNAAIPYSNVSTLTVNGGAGNDTFNVTPSSTIPITVAGNVPTTAPGDTLNVNTFGTTNPTLNVTSSSGASKNGNYTFGNRQTVTFTSIETIATTGPLTAQGTTLAATEGVPFTGATVATFTSFDPSRPASDFTATINWGDSTAFSTGTIASNGSGSFTVTGDHTYAEEGSYNIAVTIHDSANNFDATANTAATVADAPLSVGNLSPGSPTTFSGAGGNGTSGGALNAFSAFKSAVGGVDNGAAPTPKVGGFRTINWDAVKLDGTDFGGDTTVIVPNKTVGIPVNRFQERGTEFEEVYAVSGDGFVSVNPNAAGQFPAFSPNNTFAMFNDNTIGFSFVLPSVHTTTPVQAASRGFGAIFLDVETPNTTSIEYFNGTTSLGKFFVPVGTSGQPEFFGVLFQNPVVTSVQIVLGNAQLFSFDGTTVTPGDADTPPGSDLAVTDDFVYAEPTAIPTGITVTASAGEPVTATVASFKDADPAGQASDFTAIIDWGDGTTSAGTITPNASGGFDVTGAHTYTGAGVFTITTSIRDVGGSSISAASTAIIGGQSLLGSIQFSAPSTSASESAGSATVNITRTGDTSVPASVNFETSDGTAHQRSDYTFNSGTVQFAPGVTTQAVKILLVNDAFVEGPETFFVTLSNPSNNFMLGSPGTIAVTITDDDAVPTTVNPIDDTNFFVRQHYLDFLGREPDTSGFQFWTGQITACGSDAACISDRRVNVSAAFFLSIEFQETGGFVIRTQRVAFGRQSADPTSRVPYLQFMRDTRQVGAGVVVGQPGFDTLLEANKQAYAQQIVNDPAFLARFPITPAAEYVDALYASAAVAPTAAERQAAINAFGAGGTAGRVAAFRSVADSDTLRQAEFRPSFVLSEYYGYLRRNPTDAPDFNDSGYQFWLSKLNQFNGDFNKAEMVKAFIVSQEYRGRFGQP